VLPFDHGVLAGTQLSTEVDKRGSTSPQLADRSLSFLPTHLLKSQILNHSRGGRHPYGSGVGCVLEQSGFRSLRIGVSAPDRAPSVVYCTSPGALEC